MHPNHPPRIYKNSLSSHASLLLSASPTIITSPLQNNTNNPNNSTAPPSIALARKQPSTPLLVSTNSDNDGQANANSPNSLINPYSYINFKKPQNEMFKKLDGKIQKIVAAHSNLNKLYALNDFSSLGAGPKRPFELPPQLPPPPPWVPKTEFGSQWDEDYSPSPNQFDDAQIRPRPSSSMLSPTKSNFRLLAKPNTSTAQSNSKSSVTLDSAISRLHQRRRQQQQERNQIASMDIDDNLPDEPIPGSSFSSTTIQSTPTITPAQFTLLAQKIKETLESECLTKTPTESLSHEDKRKFQEDLIALLKEEITAVTKLAKLRFSPPATPSPREQKSLLLKSSPKTLFNTIRRETSLLLNKRSQHAGRSSLSLLSDQQTYNRQNVKVNIGNLIRTPINKVQTIRVIVPPTEYYSGLKLGNYMDKDTPQPTTELITIEQFAKCLNLVRSNDASLQRHQEHLLQSETKMKMNLGSRPLRLRRLPGEKMRMPVSASYRATRKVGLQ